MDSVPHLDPEVLLPELKNALRHGCRASRLIRYARPLVDAVVPGENDTLLERSLLAERALRDACASYDGDWGDAMERLLGLASGTHGSLLKDRRRQAADLVGVPITTFRRHTEHELLWDVAVEVSVKMEN